MENLQGHHPRGIDNGHLFVYGFSAVIYLTNIFKPHLWSGFFLKFFVFSYYFLVLQLELSANYNLQKITIPGLLENCSFLKTFGGRAVSNLFITFVALNIGLCSGILGKIGFVINIFFFPFLISCADSQEPKPLSYSLGDDDDDHDGYIESPQIITNSEPSFQTETV